MLSSSNLSHLYSEYIKHKTTKFSIMKNRTLKSAGACTVLLLMTMSATIAYQKLDNYSYGMQFLLGVLIATISIILFYFIPRCMIFLNEMSRLKNNESDEENTTYYKKLFSLTFLIVAVLIGSTFYLRSLTGHTEPIFPIVSAMALIGLTTLILNFYKPNHEL